MLATATSPPRAGQRMTATLGSWDDDFADYHYRVQWWRCDGSGQACAAVTDSEFVRREGPASYDITEADVGSSMRAQILVASFDYAKRTTQFTDATPVVEPGGPPRLETGPFLMVGGNGRATVRVGAGPADVGDVLSAAHGTWALVDPGLYSVRWMRCDRAAQSCVRMSEVSTPDAPAEQRWSYRVQTGDDGRSIRAEVVAANRLGSVTAQTPAVKVGAEPAGAAASGGGSSATDGKTAVRTVDIAGAKVTSTLRGVTVTLRLRRAGTLTVTATAAKGGGKLGSARKKVAAPGKVLVTVPLSRSTQKTIASGRAVRASIKASLKDADGGSATRSEKVTLKRSRR